MRGMVWGVVLTMALAGGEALGKGGGEPLLRPLDYCPPEGPACLMMDVTALWPEGSSPEQAASDFAAADAKHPAVVKVKPGEDPGQVEFHLKVRGRLKGGKPQTWRLVLTGEVEGNCSGFRNAGIPVVGFGPQGDGVLLTDQGELALEDAPLLFGCTYCLSQLDPRTLAVSELRTPSWWRRGGRVMLAEEGAAHWQVMGYTCQERSGVGGAPKPAEDAACRGARMVREGQPWEGHAWVETPRGCIELPTAGRLRRLPEPRCPGVAVEGLPKAPPALTKRVAEGNLLQDDALTRRLEQDLHQAPKGGLVFLLGARCE